jgi:hypothetical protein
MGVPMETSKAWKYTKKFRLEAGAAKPQPNRIWFLQEAAEETEK